MLFFIICACFALFPQKVIFGAQNGLALCINAIIPSLLPFMIFSDALIKSGFARPLGTLISKVITPLTKISFGGCVCLLCGLIGGYGTGIRSVIGCLDEKIITKNEAENLIGICNNAGPIFIIGTVGSSFFLSKEIGLTLFIIQLITVFLCARIFALNFGNAKRYFNDEWSTYQKSKASIGKIITESAKSSGFAMINVCSLIITFSAIMAVVETEKFPLVSAFLEVMQGVSILSREGIGVLSFVSAALSWGGVCVHLQASALCEGKVSMKKYYIQKGVSSLISFTITYLYLLNIYSLMIFLAVFILIIPICANFLKPFRQRVFRLQKHS